MARAKKSVLLIACGALAREIKELRRLGGWDHLTLHCLPASLHNRPDAIPGEVRRVLKDFAEDFDSAFVAYADCGTGGRLDAVLAEFGVERLPGAHCYEFFAGADVFAELHEEEPGTFYLTDFLVRHFQRLVIRGLGIDQHPELMPLYFGNYKRVVYLAQTESSKWEEAARECAEELGLEFIRRYTGLSELDSGLKTIHDRAASESTL